MYWDHCQKQPHDYSQYSPIYLMDMASSLGTVHCSGSSFRLMLTIAQMESEFLGGQLLHRAETLQWPVQKQGQE